MGGGRKALKAVCLCGCCIYNYINQIHISIIKDVPEHLGVNFVCWTWTKSREHGKQGINYVGFFCDV